MHSMSPVRSSRVRGKKAGSTDHPDEFDALIQAGKDSPHRPLTARVLADIWKRGRALARE